MSNEHTHVQDHPEELKAGILPIGDDDLLPTGPAAGARPVACDECARAVAMGWLGSISRHPAPPGAPVCVLCGEGEAVHTAEEWFEHTVALIEERDRDGQRRTWREDAMIGAGIRQAGE